MGDPTANQFAIALLLLLTAWAVCFLWFNPTGWTVALVLGVVGLLVARRFL